MGEDFPLDPTQVQPPQEAEAINVDVVMQDAQSEHVETQPGQKAEIMDESAEAFHNRVGQLMAEGRDIYVFRGAGTKNGIAPEDLPKAAEKITGLLQADVDAGRKVAILFDGDEDNRQKPDVGAVYGMVADTFKGNPDIALVAAQQRSWYYPKEAGGALQTASGTPIETFVFPDSTPGGHAALTQSKDLAQYDKYRQIFVGPAGAIAGDQLRDLNEKADGKKVEVLAIATHNNPNLTAEFDDKLEAAEAAGDTAKAEGFIATLKQREDQPWGMMYDKDGYRSFMPDAYPNLTITADEDIVSEFQELRSTPLKESYMDKQKAETLAPFIYSDEESTLGFMPGYGHRIDQHKRDRDEKIAQGTVSDTPEEVAAMANRDRVSMLEPVDRLYDVNPDLFASMPTKEFIAIARELSNQEVQADYVNEWEVQPAQRELAEAQAKLEKAQERLADAQKQQKDIIARYRPKEHKN